MMRPKIVLLACLLTIALPVEAEDPLIPPKDPTSIQEWLAFVNDTLPELGGCIGITNKEIENPLQTAAEMAVYIANVKQQDAQTFYFSYEAKILGYDAIFVTLQKDLLDFDICS